MKLSGIAGTGSGKLGSQVYASVAGEQVVRNYQPKVTNPNTSLQVNQRARLKLMSQLSSVFGPILAYRRKGMVSARNQFVKNNFNLSSGNDGECMITLENIQITSGTAGLPGIFAERQENIGMHINLLNNASFTCDRVVYVLFKKTDAQKLQLLGSKVATVAGADGNFPILVDNYVGDIVIYAYGMKDLNSKATANYGNYKVESGEDIATLVMSRQLDYNDYRFTRTRGAQILAAETQSRSAGPGEVRVFVTASGPGAVTGSNIYNRGDMVVLQAIPDAAGEFIGWKQNGGNTFVSTCPAMVFAASELVDLIAVFQNPESTTGGLDGHELSNPLPLLSAEVHIDGNTLDITTGIGTTQGEYDRIGISNVGDGDILVFVPYGSEYGDADNIVFNQEGTQQDDYEIDSTGMGSATIYLNGQVFFYVNAESQSDPMANASFIINNVGASVHNGEIVITSEILTDIKVLDVPAGQTMQLKNDGNTYDLTYQTGEYRILNQSIRLVNMQLWVNGTKFCNIRASIE